jgi:hypothetical protein
VGAHPSLELAAVVVGDPAKVGVDAGELAGAGTTLGVAATDDLEAALTGADAVVYAVSGDLRAEEAVADVTRALCAGATVVTASLYGLYDPRSAPVEVLGPLVEACRLGGASLFVSGIDPGWGNDILPVLLSGLGSAITQIRCQEIFDYSSYDQPDAVRKLVGMGMPLSYEPPMLAPTVPSMIWGGQLRLLARALELELDEVHERLERRPLEVTVTNAMGEFAAGTQGAVRFQVEGVVAGDPLLVVDHVTRIDPACAPDWPSPPDGGAGVHRVILEGRPRLEVTIAATDEGDGRAAGGNATAVARLVNAIPWLLAAEPDVYDALDVPLTPAIGRISPRSGGGCGSS